MADLKTFKLELDQWHDEMEQEFALRTKFLALDLFTRIVYRTPRDTGRAQNNWQIAIGSPDRTVTEGGGSTAQALQKTQKLGVVKPFIPIFITNGLPYIVPLEEGHSKQSPAGTMVALSVEEVQSFAKGFDK